MYTPQYPNLQMLEGDSNNKGTSKRHKTDKKPLILRCTFLHQYLIKKPSHYIHPQFNFPLGRLKITNIDEETCTTVCPFFGLIPTQKLIYLFVEILF